MILPKIKQISNKYFYVILYITTSLILLNSLIRSKVINENSNCGWDGAIYCAMARNELGYEPFSRRTLLPSIVRLIPGTPTYKDFYFLNLIFSLLAIFFAYKLISHINLKSRWIFIALLIVNPSFIRMLVTYPVLTDYLALLLIMLFFYVHYSKSGNLWLSLNYIIVSLLAFVRENLSITIGISILISEIINRNKLSKSLIFFAFTVFVTFLSFQQPTTSPTSTIGSSISSVVLFWVIENSKDFNQLIRFIYLLILGIGVTGLFGIFQGRSILSKYKLLYIFSLILFVSGAFLGGDNARISSIPGVLLTLLWLLYEKSESRKKIILTLTIVLWMPFYFSDGTNESYFYMYAQRATAFQVTTDQITSFLGFTFGLLLFVVIFASTRIKSVPHRKIEK
jgi:hypothetical protein